MEIRNSDIKVFGRIAAITTEGVVASAEQIQDDKLKQNQQTINNHVNSELQIVDETINNLSNTVIRQTDTITEEQIKALFV